MSRVVDLVRSYVGTSRDYDADRLGALVARGVDDPRQAVAWSTNCATFALGVLAALGVDHALLRTPYVDGMAPAWLFTIGRALGVCFAWDSTRPLRIGQLLHYATPGKADDHVEWVTRPRRNGYGWSAGGGRPRNAITETTGTLVSSSSRPLRYVFDVPWLVGERPELARGSTDVAVFQLQRLLNARGARLVVDGRWGAATDAALVAAGFVAGHVGDAMWGAL